MKHILIHSTCIAVNGSLWFSVGGEFIAFLTGAQVGVLWMSAIVYAVK